MDVTCSQIYLHLCQDIPEGIAIYLNWTKIPEQVAMAQMDFLFQGCRWKTFHLQIMVPDEYNLSSEADEHGRDEFPK